MKRFITATLALAMTAAMSVTAFAAGGTSINQGSSEPKTGDTAVHFSVAPTYTVTIPSDVELLPDTATNTYKGSGTITTDAIRLGKNHVVTVKLSGDFELTSAEGATLDYTVTVDGESTALADEGTAAQFSTDTAAQSVKLNYSAANPEYAGIYRDTLTFTISAPAVADPADAD